MGYAYELNICKFDLKLYKLVGVNFMTVSHVLIIFFESIHNFLFAFFLTRCLNQPHFITKERLGPKFKKCGNDHVWFAVIKTKQITLYFLEASTKIIFFNIHLFIIRLIRHHFIFYLIYILTLLRQKSCYLEQKSFLHILSITFLSKVKY